MPSRYRYLGLLFIQKYHDKMPSTANKGPSEADIIFNRANVALARSQALIDSWLPPKTAEEIANTKSEEEIRKEEEEIFKPSPEL